MTKKEKAERVRALLAEKYPDPECGLHWKGEPWRLLIMAILSAQCSDAQVNKVSESLFARFPTAQSMAEAKLSDIEDSIRTLGLFRAKAKALSETSRRLVEAYGGVVPSDMKDLLTFRGVGRKVANLIRGDIFGLGGIVADTHCIRISGRLGFSDGKDPLRTERALDKLIPVNEQSVFCHRLVHYGREVCSSRAPKCDECILKEFCRV